MTWVSDPDSDHVGSPFPSNELKLIDVPNMMYTTEDRDENGEYRPRGEICLRGNNCFKGYYKLKDQTEASKDEDNWVHTGDIGMIIPGGKVRIIDRKKDVFKLSPGEYIVPEKLETKYETVPYISQIFIYGDSLQSYCVAVIVPEEEKVVDWAKKKHIEYKNFEELIKKHEVYELFFDELKKKAQEQRVS